MQSVTRPVMEQRQSVMEQRQQLQTQPVESQQLLQDMIDWKKSGREPDSRMYEQLAKRVHGPKSSLVLYDYLASEKQHLITDRIVRQITLNILDTKSESRIRDIWQDCLSFNTHLESPTLLHFLKAFGNINDEAMVIKMHEILAQRRQKEPWTQETNLLLMDAYLKLKKYQKVVHVFQGMDMNAPTPIYSTLLKALIAIQDHPQIKMIAKITMRDLKVDTNSVLIFIQSATETQDEQFLKRISVFCKDHLHELDLAWSKIYDQLILAHDLKDARKLLLRYKQHRQKTHKSFTTQEMEQAFVDNDETLLKDFRSWTPPELPRNTLASFAFVLGKTRDEALIMEYFDSLVFETIGLHASRLVSKLRQDQFKIKELQTQKQSKVTQESIQQGRELKQLKQQLKKPIDARIGKEGPFAIVYERHQNH
ncbi:hypothetical protein EDD86DRAFT_244248 [Gorgonomyces haynaldii]|nr:hypothetical protein EDD86DRAFT_244248 [Gorgonomyces haynaldii]